MLTSVLDDAYIASKKYLRPASPTQACKCSTQFYWWELWRASGISISQNCPQNFQLDTSQTCAATESWCCWWESRTTFLEGTLTQQDSRLQTTAVVESQPDIFFDGHTDRERGWALTTGKLFSEQETCGQPRAMAERDEAHGHSCLCYKFDGHRKKHGSHGWDQGTRQCTDTSPQMGLT